MSHTHFPSYWAIAPLEEITKSVTSGSRGWGDYYSESGPLFLRVGNLDHDTVHIDLSDSVHVQPPSGSEGLRTRVEEGDILISITAEVGMIGLAGPGLGEAYVNQHVALVRPLPSVYPKGLAYSLLDPQGLQAVARREQYGATKPGLSLIQVRRFQVPIPPLPEQQRIVEVIESYFTRLDDAVATLERVERNLKRYRASVLKAAVEGRLVPTEAALAKQAGRDYEPACVLLERILTERRRRWSESGKKGKYEEPTPADTTNLPDLAEGWCWASMDQLTDHLTSGSRDWSKYYDRGTCVFVMAQNVRPGRLEMTFKQYVDPPLNDASRTRTAVAEGDLLVTIVGANTGDVCRVPLTLNDHYVCQSIALMRPTLTATSEYLDLYLNSPNGRKVYEGFMYGQGRPHLGFEHLKGTPVPLPPDREIGRIVKSSLTAVSAVESLEQGAATNLKRVARLRQSILKWAFEGKLADQDSNDEPASVLLERIKAERAAPARPSPRSGRRPRALP